MDKRFLISAKTTALLALLFYLSTTLTSCRSHKEAVGVQPHLPATPTERRTAIIDLDNAQTFMDNSVRVRERYHFRDLNGEQLEAAQRSGFTPLDDRKQAERATRRLNLIETNQYYVVDPLTHSIPYLGTPAKRLLDDLARIFQNSLVQTGYRPHRIIVTSLLRTRDDVEKLRRVNGNAARNSSHMYATSFDVSWSRFNRISTDGRPATNETLAAYLGEAIYYLRQKGRCVVIYERQQHCFHITVVE